MQAGLKNGLYSAKNVLKYVRWILGNHLQAVVMRGHIIKCEANGNRRLRTPDLRSFTPQKGKRPVKISHATAIKTVGKIEDGRLMHRHRAACASVLHDENPEARSHRVPHAGGNALLRPDAGDYQPF